MRGIAGLLLAIAISDPNPQSATSATSGPSTGHLVRIDVIATDARGRGADDLDPADFELREEGSPQPIERVQFVRAPAGQQADAPVLIQTTADERQAAAGAGARLFAIFLDEYHVSPGLNTDRVREALTRFLDREIGAGDLVVVMKPLDSVLAIRMTRDREAARRSIGAFEGRRGVYEPRNTYERNFIAGTPARIEVARTQVALSAINALAVHLGSLTDRRKTVIVVTEGIARSERRRGQEYLPTFDTIVRSANRANVSVYPVDPRDGPPDDSADPLRKLAVETAGQPIDVDLDLGLRRAAADASAYYLLTYYSSRPDDGKFHEVQVRVTRAGIRLRARNGYWAPSADDVLRAEILERINNPKPPAPMEPAPHASQLIRPWFGLSRGTAGKTRVTFVWEPAAHVPGDRVRHSPSRLVLTAISSDGTVLFEGPVSPTGPLTVDEPGATPARAVFDVPPGRLRLRMSIQDAAAQVLDRDVRDLSIRALGGDVAIGTPEVLRARNAREFRSIDVGASVPVSAREFSRTERLLIRFQAYGAGGARPSVSAKLMGRSGQAIRNLVVTPASAPDGENEIDLPLAGLAAGDYTIEVTATAASGDATDRISFRVTS